MTRKHAIWTTLAAGHLVLVACGAARLTPEPNHAAGWSVWWYGSLSGGTNSYGFFKEVGSGCKVTLTMADEDGNTWEDELDRAGNREAWMRANGSIYMIVDFYDPLAASWAANMFARHPRARQVFVQFDQFEPPSMADYSRGARPEWRTTYAQVFLRTDVDAE